MLEGTEQFLENVKKCSTEQGLGTWFLNWELAPDDYVDVELGLRLDAPESRRTYFMHVYEKKGVTFISLSYGYSSFGASIRDTMFLDMRSDVPLEQQALALYQEFRSTVETTHV